MLSRVEHEKGFVSCLMNKIIAMKANMEDLDLSATNQGLHYLLGRFCQ